MRIWKTIIGFSEITTIKRSVYFFNQILSSLSVLGITYLLSYYINTIIINVTGINKTLLLISLAVLAAYIIDLLIGVFGNAVSRRVTARSSQRIQKEAIEYSVSDDYLHFFSKDQRDKQSYVTNISGNGNSTI